MTAAERAKKEPGIRPAWVLALRGYLQLDSPLTLAEIHQSDKFVRDFFANLATLRVRPQIFLQNYPGHLRAIQGGYIAKMPAAFVAHWQKLRNVVEKLTVTPISLPSSSDTENLAMDMLEQVTAPAKSSQGFSVDPERRKEIEGYAVERAKEYFDRQGCSRFEDRGRPYDFHCVTASGTILYVEVKGTTTTGEEVLVTRNEVEYHRKHVGDTALYVLSDIEVSQENGKATARKGKEHVFWPWLIEKCELEPLAYTCRLSAAGQARSEAAP